MLLNLLSDSDKKAIAQDRDERVFRRLFLDSFHPLCNYAFYFLKDRHLAEDVTAEIMWKIWFMGSDLLYINSLEKYLLRAVKNRCLNLLRVRSVDYVSNDELLELDSRIDLNTPENLLLQSEFAVIV